MFQFIIAVIKINCYLAFQYFVFKNLQKDMTLQEFRSHLGWALIDNSFLTNTDSPTANRVTRRRVTKHKLATAPQHAKKFENGKCDLSSSWTYQQYLCRTPGCTKKIRTYCICDVGKWLCNSCFAEHINNSDF